MWRVKHYNLKITPSRKLVISFRQFKTPKATRAKSFKQLVIPLYFLPLKEVAIKQVKKRNHRRRSSPFAFLQKSTITFILMILIGVSGTLYFGIKVGGGKKHEPVKTFSPVAPVATAKQPNSNTGLPHSIPLHIRIPSVEIDYDIMQVGKQADGTIETPPLFQSITGWYKYSPSPGEVGPAIILGHVDTYKGPSVFWRLRDLQPGALVEITRADGKTATFKVEALKQFDQDNFPTNEVYGNIDHPGLRLITCGGTFNQATGHYDQNTVVFASIVI